MLDINSHFKEIKMLFVLMIKIKHITTTKVFLKKHIPKRRFSISVKQEKRLERQEKLWGSSFSGYTDLRGKRDLTCENPKDINGKTTLTKNWPLRQAIFTSSATGGVSDALPPTSLFMIYCWRNMIYSLRRMIYLLRKNDIISVLWYAEDIYHPLKADIISKIYHPFRKERISLKKARRSVLFSWLPLPP